MSVASWVAPLAGSVRRSMRARPACSLRGDVARMRAEALATLDALERAWAARGEGWRPGEQGATDANPPQAGAPDADNVGSSLAAFPPRPEPRRPLGGAVPPMRCPYAWRVPETCAFRSMGARPLGRTCGCRPPLAATSSSRPSRRVADRRNGLRCRTTFLVAISR